MRIPHHQKRIAVPECAAAPRKAVEVDANHLSVNYQFADILNPPAKRLTLDRIVIKAMLNASSKPLDSIGAAIGYTFPKWGFGGVGLNALSVFVGRFWTRQDAIVDGNPVINSAYAKSWRVGISYNFSDALSKVKL